MPGDVLEITGVHESDTVDETEALGFRLASELGPGTLVFLDGQLGAGKTAFVRGVLAGLGGDRREVSSPTYALVHRYPTAGPELIHVDLYRIDDPEVGQLVFTEELEESVVVVEWPGNGIGTLGQPTFRIRIEHAGGDRRRIDVSGPGSVPPAD